MRLIAAKTASQMFPDGTRSEYVRLTFEQDGDVVHKNARISHCARVVSSDLRKEAAYLVVKLAREAARDFAFMEGGMEAVKHADVSGLDGCEILDEALKLLTIQPMGTDV